MIIEDLVITDYGAFVGLNGGRLRVEVKQKRTLEAPLMHLRSVQIHTRSASISAAALAACCEAGVPVYFLDTYEGNYASVLSSRLTTVVTTRRAQLEALSGSVGVAVARALACGKITSQALTLRYLRRRQEELAEPLKTAETELLVLADRLENSKAQNIETMRAVWMGTEGYAARLYWEVLGRVFPEEYAWPGRIGRHAQDDANTLLNYGYGILYGEVQTALMIAGLDPYAGLLHTDRPGKPSLTCDLIEEFRAPIVDRTVVGLLNRRFAVGREADGRMTRETRKQYAEHILSRLRAQGSHEGKRYELRSIIQRQARKLAAALRGEAVYTPYLER